MRKVGFIQQCGTTVIVIHSAAIIVLNYSFFVWQNAQSTS